VGAFDEDAPFHTDFITQSAADMETIASELTDPHGLGVGILRLGWFCSADSAHTRCFGQQIAGRKLPIIGKGDAVWSRVHVDDAAAAFVAVAEAGRSGLWHVVDNEPVTGRDDLRYFASRLGAPEPRHVPVWLARLGAGPVAVDFMTGSTRTTTEPVGREFGSNPRFSTYKEGLAEVISTWRSENFLGLGTKAAA
jgi:nucleoside-diphosphate-sugar epimerase